MITLCCYFRPIVQLINGHNVNGMVNASAALQAMCEDNVHAQVSYIEYKAQRALIKLLKVGTQGTVVTDVVHVVVGVVHVFVGVVLWS